MKLFSSLLLLLLLFSCNNNARKEPTEKTSLLPPTAGDTTEAVPEIVDKGEFYVWDVNSGTKTKKQNPQLRPNYYNVDTLLMGLNERYPRIRLEKKRLGHDTLYTEIKDAGYLTEQLGSTGAEAYVAQAVLNLTSVKGIRYLRIDFAEGSHASPDVWSAENFRDYKEVQ